MSIPSWVQAELDVFENARTIDQGLEHSSGLVPVASVAHQVKRQRPRRGMRQYMSGRSLPRSNPSSLERTRPWRRAVQQGCGSLNVQANDQVGQPGTNPGRELAKEAQAMVDMLMWYNDAVLCA